jgi:hypothetical protein
MADRVTAPIGIVAGSGLDLIDVLDCKTMEVPFDTIPGLVPSGVAGHDGMFIHGAYRGTPVIVQCGRIHFYEGHRYEDVVRPVDVLHDAGVQTIVFTNAAGALLKDLKPGEFVAADEIRTWPFNAWPARPGSLTLDFQLPNCEATGPYMWVSGPSYETPAEIALLQQQGGAVVGMSTAPEVHRAQSTRDTDRGGLVRDERVRFGGAVDARRSDQNRGAGFGAHARDGSKLDRKRGCLALSARQDVRDCHKTGTVPSPPRCAWYSPRFA